MAIPRAQQQLEAATHQALQLPLNKVVMVGA